MAEARALKLCTKGYFSSLAKVMTNLPLKGRGFAHVTHSCMHNCGVRENLVTARCYRRDQQDQRRTIAYHTYGGRGHTKA